MNINRLNNTDFYIVSLMNKRKIDIKLVLLIGVSVVSVIVVSKLFDYFTGIYFFSIIVGTIISFILFVLWIIIVTKLWIKYLKMYLMKKLPKNGKRLKQIMQEINLFKNRLSGKFLKQRK